MENRGVTDCRDTEAEPPWGSLKLRWSSNKIEVIINLYLLMDQISDHACNIKPVYACLCALKYIDSIFWKYKRISKIYCQAKTTSHLSLVWTHKHLTYRCIVVALQLQRYWLCLLLWCIILASCFVIRTHYPNLFEWCDLRISTPKLYPLSIFIIK